MKISWPPTSLLILATIVAIGCDRLGSVSSTGGEAAITDSQFSEAVASSELTLVKFGAPWCGPCKMVDQELDELTSEMDIVKINVDNNRELAKQYGVSGIPHLILFRSGKPIDSKVGYLPASEILAWAGNHRAERPGEVQDNPFAR